MRDKRYMISDASKIIDVEPHVLRYWEIELGVDIPRNELGHRFYKSEHVELLKSVKALKDKGFQLKAIKLLLPDIKKVEALEVERLYDLRDKLDIAMGLVGIDAYSKEPAGSDAECKSDVNLEGDNVVKGEKKELDNIMLEKDSEVNSLLETTEDSYKEMQDVKNEETGVGFTKEENSSIKEESSSKLIQFKNIMCGIMVDAMKENNENLTKAISDSITDSVIKELDYLLRMREEREEEHFKQLDRTIREYQLQRQQTAVARDMNSSKKKESKFFKKNNKVRI